ncbi:hypothetical protein [Cyanothece sp. BG0011]|uniref:hypothetical protein n=1 Tax=Cyanothece sp. BG0011 TaxID=2082950 RepID=UPI000D1E73F5|nr:hypothetical protein [Cyanothece sp. BG0011]
MIISDLETLETVHPNRCFDSYGGLTIMQPTIDLNSLVAAFNQPLSLVMAFSGEVDAGDHAFLKVDQRAVVKNLGFGPQWSI